MREDEARRLLGVAVDADQDAVRVAYRRLVRDSHPDLNPAGDANERTARLTAAYRVLRAAGSGRAGRGGGLERTEQHPVPDRQTIAVALVDDDTIGVAALPDETMAFLIDAAHDLGDISYLDRSAGLLEVVVEFVEAPTSSIVLSLQGRASGVTEVFCTVEPLSGGTAPPSAAVTRLLLDALRRW